MSTDIILYVGISLGTLLLALFILDKLDLVPKKLKPFVPYLLFGIPAAYSIITILLLKRKVANTEAEALPKTKIIKDRSEEFDSDIEELNNEITEIKKEQDTPVDDSSPDPELSKFISEQSGS